MVSIIFVAEKQGPIFDSALDLRMQSGASEEEQVYGHCLYAGLEAVLLELRRLKVTRLAMVQSQTMKEIATRTAASAWDAWERSHPKNQENE
jgi:hypothetical protein